MTAPTAPHAAVSGAVRGPISSVLSVTEIQGALHYVLARRGHTDTTGIRPAGGAFFNSPRERGLRLGREWVAVLAAHAGAGASTVALALVDAMAAQRRTSRLVEIAGSARSGLIAAAQTELGADATGGWRRGTRGTCTILRPASAGTPQRWPQADAPVETVVDMGLPDPGGLPRLAGDGAWLVVVCRVTVPGFRACEQMLAALPHGRVVVAAVGPARWPGPVVASNGPRLRAAREGHRLAAVPHDRRLEISGLGAGPLPKPVAAAGQALLDLLNAGRGDAPATPPTGAQQGKEASR